MLMFLASVLFRARLHGFCGTILEEKGSLWSIYTVLHGGGIVM